LDSRSGAELSDRLCLDEYIDRKRRLDRVYEALHFLNEREHDLIDLFYFQEMSITKISEIVGKSRSAIKMGLLRGWKRIIELVAEPSFAAD
jgi:RNA polymerase sigma factor (sigma-70 family)